MHILQTSRLATERVVTVLEKRGSNLFSVPKSGFGGEIPEYIGFGSCVLVSDYYLLEGVAFASRLREQNLRRCAVSIVGGIAMFVCLVRID